MPVIPLSLNAPHQIMGHSHPNSSIPMPPKLSLPTSHNSTTIFGITQWMPNKVNTIDHKSKARGQWLRRWSIDSPFLLHIQHQSKIRTFCFLRLSREDLIYWHSPEERYFALGLVQHVQKMGGVHGSLAPLLSYSFGAVDYGILFIWPSLGYAKKSHWYVCNLAGVPWQA